MSRRARNSIFAAIIVLAAGCHGVPSEVIQPEEMAQLMADVHTGEALVDMNRREYETDSAKQAFKQSVYARHGVTSAQVDSSMAWYGRNITRYMDVYDRTIEILEHRLTETGNRVAAEAALSMAGDSVDVWPHPRYLAISPKSPTAIITFHFNADENWEPGDYYTWRTKILNNGGQSEWSIAGTYTDGSVETVYNGFGGDGRREILFRSDSTRILRSLSGYMRAALPDEGPVRLDSIELVRKRLDPGLYNERYRQRRVSGYAMPDSTSADSI